MIKKLLLNLVFLFFLSSCDNYTTRYFGGEMEISVPQGYEVKMATWKSDGGLWVLFESKDSTYLQEYSMYGILEGRVNFNK